MRTDHILWTLGKCCNLVHIKRRSVRSQNGAGFHDRIELREYLFLDRHVFEYRLNHDISWREIRVRQSAADQSHALVELLLCELALFHGVFVVLAYRCQPFIQCFLFHLEHFYGDTGVGKVHCNASTHRACTNDCSRFDFAQGRVGRHVWHLGSCTFTEKCMTQRLGFGCLHQLQEKISLVANTIIKFLVDRSGNCINTLERRWKFSRNCAHRITGKLQVAIGVRIIQPDISDLGQRPCISYFFGESQRAFDEITFDHLVEQFCA